MRTIREGTPTPWGPAQDVIERFPGFYDVGTASHGGVYVDPELAAEMPPMFRRRSWYEEDCDWAIPYYWFRDRLGTSANVYVKRNLLRVAGTLKRWQTANVLEALGEETLWERTDS